MEDSEEGEGEGGMSARGGLSRSGGAGVEGGETEEEGDAGEQRGGSTRCSGGGGGNIERGALATRRGGAGAPPVFNIYCDILPLNRVLREP
jgi:hypothetical protein